MFFVLQYAIDIIILGGETSSVSISLHTDNVSCMEMDKCMVYEFYFPAIPILYSEEERGRQFFLGLMFIFLFSLPQYFLTSKAVSTEVI